MFDPVKYLSNPHDAFQEPCHRWLRCQYLLEHNRPPTPQDDAITHDTWAFLHDWQVCHNDVEREQLAHTHPALAEAHRFYQNATSRQRAELEARLLAGDSNDSIAGPCKLSPVAIRIFHELYFEVRPYLQAEYYILNLAIGPKVHYGLTADDHDVLLKLAGYTLGAAAVDQLLAYWDDPPVWPLSLTPLDDPALETLRAKLLVQAWILSQTLPTDAATAARLPAVRRLLTRAGVLGGGAAGEENTPPATVRATLNCHAGLSTTEAAACDPATLESSIVASDVPQPAAPARPCPREQQKVPA